MQFTQVSGSRSKVTQGHPGVGGEGVCEENARDDPDLDPLVTFDIDLWMTFDLDPE